MRFSKILEKCKISWSFCVRNFMFTMLCCILRKGFSITLHLTMAISHITGEPPWSNIMRLLTDRDSTETELLIYAMSLLNKTLNGIPDQDSYYDQVDALEEQGIASVIRRWELSTQLPWCSGYCTRFARSRRRHRMCHRGWITAPTQRRKKNE